MSRFQKSRCRSFHDFGALDDADNPFTRSYTNVTYDRLFPPSTVQGSRHTNHLSNSLVSPPWGTPLDGSFFYGHYGMVPGVDHTALRQLQRSRDAESPTEQGAGVHCRSKTARFQKTGIEGRCGKERCHEFARFVTPLIAAAHLVVNSLSPQLSPVILSARAGD